MSMEIIRHRWMWLMVPAEGFEPPTYCLQNRCTTTVLSRQIDKLRRYAGSGAHSTAAVANNDS